MQLSSLITYSLITYSLITYSLISFTYSLTDFPSRDEVHLTRRGGVAFLQALASHLREMIQCSLGLLLPLVFFLLFVIRNQGIVVGRLVELQLSTVQYSTLHTLFGS
jgi:hypothetical protein